MQFDYCEHVNSRPAHVLISLLHVTYMISSVTLYNIANALGPANEHEQQSKAGVVYKVNDGTGSLSGV